MRIGPPAKLILFHVEQHSKTCLPSNHLRRKIIIRWWVGIFSKAEVRSCVVLPSGAGRVSLLVLASSQSILSRHKLSWSWGVSSSKVLAGQISCLHLLRQNNWFLMTFQPFHFTITNFGWVDSAPIWTHNSRQKLQTSLQVL